jgi:PmbA protein
MKNIEAGSYILTSLTAAGADKADCNVSCTRMDELNIDNGNINLLRSIFTTDITMKAIKDRKSGVISINSSDKETLDKAVSDCMEAAEVSLVEEAEDIAEITENCVIGSEAEVDLDMLYFRLEELVKDTAKSYPKINLNEIHAIFKSGSRIHRNTNGVEMEEFYHYYEVMLEFSARDKDTSSSISEYGIATEKLDQPFLKIGNLAQVFEQAEASIYPKSLEGKFEGTVLLMPNVLHQILSSLQGLMLSDSPLIDGTSQWKNALDQEVAVPDFTLSCDYSDRDLVSSGSVITHDGYRAEDLTVIDHGVLKSFLISRFGSRKTGISRSKNYGGYFVVEPGNQSLEDMISSIDKGILMGALSGKQPDSSGEVSGVAKTSFLIENGKIKGAINETMISCNLLDMLKNIRAISREQICNGYYKLPYIAFDGVVISGK